MWFTERLGSPILNPVTIATMSIAIARWSVRVRLFMIYHIYIRSLIYMMAFQSEFNAKHDGANVNSDTFYSSKAFIKIRLETKVPKGTGNLFFI